MTEKQYPCLNTCREIQPIIFIKKLDGDIFQKLVLSDVCNYLLKKKLMNKLYFSTRLSICYLLLSKGSVEVTC